jgi:hypothetical protein
VFKACQSRRTIHGTSTSTRASKTRHTCASWAHQVSRNSSKSSVTMSFRGCTLRCRMTSRQLLVVLVARLLRSRAAAAADSPTMRRATECFRVTCADASVKVARVDPETRVVREHHQPPSNDVFLGVPASLASRRHCRLGMNSGSAASVEIGLLVTGSLSRPTTRMC